MAQVPRVFQVDQQPAGAIQGQFAMRSEAPPTDFGASAGRALTAVGGALDQAAQVGVQQVIREQEIQNETEAVEKSTALAQQINEEYARFAELQGTAATEAFPQFQQRIRELREGALAGASNQRVRQMLQQRTAGPASSALAQGAQWNIRQTRTANVQANEASAAQSISDGIRDRADPRARGAALSAGLASIDAIGRTAGWDEATLRQRRAEYTGRFYSGIIATVAETDPLAANRIFEANRNVMDAASQVRIQDMLSAPVRRERAAGIVDEVTREPAPATSANAARDAIFRAENPAGDARRNPTPGSTASGPGQITDETWRAYAGRLGLNDAQRNDRAAHEAIFDAYMSDARRAIGRDLTVGEQYAAWFLGIPAARAFINGPRDASAREVYQRIAGEQRTAFAFRSNGGLLRDGMTVQQVLDAVSSRVSGNNAPRPRDTGEMLRTAVERAGNDTQLRSAVIAQFNQWRTVQEAGQAQERASMSARVEDISNALAVGGNVSIPEADIRRVFPPEQADRVLDRLYTQQIAGQVYQSVQLATPAELQALRDDLQNGTGPISELLRFRRGTRLGSDGSVAEEDRAGDVAARGAMQRVLEERIQQRQRDLAADPAQFVIADPTVREAAQRAAAEPQSEEAMRNYVTATLAAQQRLGVAPENQRVLSKAQAQSIAAEMLRADPGGGTAENPDTPALRLRGLAQSYGQAWPRVFQDLVRDGGLPPDYQVLANIPSAVGQADFARMMAAARQMGGMNRLRDTAPAAGRQQIEREMSTYTEAFRRTAMASGQAGGAALAGLVHNAAENLAIYYTISGMTPSEAMQRATDRIINDKYEIMGTMRVPRALPNGRPLGLQPVRAAQTEVMRGLRAEDLADIPGNPELPESERRNIAWRAAQRGTWAPNERDNGLVLMMDLENGGRLPVRTRDGGRVEIFYDRLPSPTLPSDVVVGTDGLIYDSRGNLRGDDPEARARANAADRANLRGERQRREQERNARPPQPGVAPGQPPVGEVLPGDPRGRSGTQPRTNRWEPPQ